MTDAVLTTFQTLCDKRECAAYQCAGAIKTALALLTVGDAKQALDILEFARADYDLADSQISAFLNSKKENQPNGNATSQSAA